MFKNKNKKNIQAEAKLSQSHCFTFTSTSISMAVASATFILASGSALAYGNNSANGNNSNNQAYLQSDLAQNEQLYKEVQAAQMGFVLNSNQPSQVMKVADNSVNNNTNNTVVMGAKPDAVYNNQTNMNGNTTTGNNTTRTVNTVNNIHEVDIHNVVIATPMNNNGDNTTLSDNDEQLKQENQFRNGVRHESSPTIEPTYHLAIQRRDTEPYVSASAPGTPVAPKYWGADNQNYNANLATDNQIFPDDKNGDSNGIHTHVSRQDVKQVNVEELDPSSNNLVTQRFNFSHTVNYPLSQPKKAHVQALLNAHPEDFYVLNMSLVKRDDIKGVTQVLLTAQDYVQNNQKYSFKYNTNQIYTDSFYCDENGRELPRPTEFFPNVSENNFRPYINVEFTPHLNNNYETNHAEIAVGAQLIDRLAPVRTSIICDGHNYKSVVGKPYALGLNSQEDVKTQVGEHQAIQLSNHYYLVYWLQPLATITNAQVN